MTITKWDELQLKFDLPELDEVEDDARERMITPEEARLISEAAGSALQKRIERTNWEKKYPEWFKDFLMLREQGWTWRVGCYIAWASSPRNGRWPDTLQELATEVLGLKSPRVVYTWRKKYASIDASISMLQTATLWEHRRDVIAALVKMAMDPDYKSFNDRKLYLEMVGDYTPKSKLELGKAGKGEGLDELSDEELRTWMGADNSQQPIEPSLPSLPSKQGRSPTAPTDDLIEADMPQGDGASLEGTDAGE
jgi:hypothetical protein